MTYYSDASLITTMNGTPEQAEELNAILSQVIELDQQMDDQPTGDHGLSAEYKSGSIHLFNKETDVCPNELTPVQIQAIRQLIIANELAYIEFGIAYHASKPVPAAYDGGRFRIYATDNPSHPTPVVWPELVWPEITKAQ
jgi:hypothetical protein